MHRPSTYTPRPRADRGGKRLIKASALYRWWEKQDPDPAKRPTVAAMAKRFKTSTSTIYGLLDGSRSPSLELAKTIERETQASGSVVLASEWPTRKARR